MEKVIDFLKIKKIYGYGDGSGYGYGDGSGDGSGSGDGYGYGDGSGDGSGSIIKKIGNRRVHYVDNIPCIFKKIVGNIAKVILVNEDYSLDDKITYIAKNDYMFAHGETAKEALEELTKKYFSKLNVEQKIIEFKKLFVNGKVENKVLFDWHSILTGSCLLGRKRFAESHNIDLENGEMSLDEFIDLTKNEYGGETIRRIKNGN